MGSWFTNWPYYPDFNDLVDRNYYHRPDWSTWRPYCPHCSPPRCPYCGKPLYMTTPLTDPPWKERVICTTSDDQVESVTTCACSDDGQSD